jgi:hypothetical protein
VVPELVEGRYSVFFTAEDAENAVAVAEFIEASTAVPGSTAVPELVEGAHPPVEGGPGFDVAHPPVEGGPWGSTWLTHRSKAVPELVEGHFTIAFHKPRATTLSYLNALYVNYVKIMHNYIRLFALSGLNLTQNRAHINVSHF